MIIVIVYLIWFILWRNNKVDKQLYSLLHAKIYIVEQQ